MPNSNAEKLLLELKKTYLAALPAQIDSIESLVLQLESGTNFTENFQHLFRKVHSLKGSAGTYGVDIITTICHQFEDGLSLIDSHAKSIQSDQVETWLQYIDLMRQSSTLADKGQTVYPEIEQALAKLKTTVLANQFSALIVDNSPSIIKLCTGALSDKHFHFVTMNDGYRALHRLLQEKFDLLITSTEVNTLNGVALISAIKFSRGMNKNIKTILLSSSDNVEYPSCIEPDSIFKKDKTLINTLIKKVNRWFKLPE